MSTLSASPALPLPPIPGEPPVRLLPLLAGLAASVAMFDLCFWHIPAFGLSTPVFFLAAAGIILALRPSPRWTATTPVILALLGGAASAAVVETSFSNALVFLALLPVLAGDGHFFATGSAWGRTLAQLVALARAPGRPFWLAAQLARASKAQGLGAVGGVVTVAVLSLPALVLVVVFGLLLANGNAVFGNWVNLFFNWLWANFSFDLDPLRIFLWVVVAFVMLPLLRPVRVTDVWWAWTLRLPRWPEIVPARPAFFSSALTLATLNLLFLAANGADALYLWQGNVLPAGLTYSGYVHSGTETLTLTVLLSALVLVTIFQQASTVTRRPLLRGLALVWIGQNLFLIVSVTLRLKLYIEAYDMTISRLGVLIFLALVTAGYGLLTIKITREKSLSWLLGGCLLAVFATFYLTQFLNLAGWSADYNVAQWEKDRSRQLDAVYLQRLGPAAWPALRQARDAAPDNPHLEMALNRARGRLDRAQCSPGTWRQFSLLAWLNRNALAAP